MSNDTPTTTKPNAPECVEFKLDGKTISAPKGKNLLEAILEHDEAISYFCYHPGLSVVAQCRQCLVAVGNNPKLTPSCQMEVQPGLDIRSNTPEVFYARQKMLEYTLVNHPVDCVICDKAGECTLQRHYMDWDAKASLVNHEKVDKPKKVDLGPNIVLDAERCILCSRCIRFCAEIAKDPQLVFAQRGDHTVLTTPPGTKLDNPYSLNTVDICPVGALTDKDFRFKIRVWELFSTRSVCQGCSAGCETEIHHKDNTIYRMVPPKDWDMNLNWMCDAGRRTHKSAIEHRVTAPLLRGKPAGWDDALKAIVKGFKVLLTDKRPRIGIVLAADITNEDAFAASRFAFDFIEAGRVYFADLPDDNKGDAILRRNDPNPNRAGVKACGRGQFASMTQLDEDLRADRLSALYIVGNNIVLPDTIADRLATLELFAIQTSHHNSLTAKAHVVLPAMTWTEVDATTTNFENNVKRLRRAVKATGSARPHWQLVGMIARELGLTMQFETPLDLFTEMTKQVEFFAHASWGEPLPTKQLRFAGRRG